MTDYQTICGLHSDAIWEIGQFLKDGEYRHLDVALADIKQAKKCGQRMEKRLKKYCYTIEKLGFERIR